MLVQINLKHYRNLFNEELDLILIEPRKNDNLIKGIDRPEKVQSMRSQLIDLNLTSATFRRFKAPALFLVVSLHDELSVKIFARLNALQMLSVLDVNLGQKNIVDVHHNFVGFLVLLKNRDSSPNRLEIVHYFHVLPDVMNS